mmetsp:Transcript_81158/g.161443  ORF Transcript_81158/g.161443 Transcript_81158/m.161443 type:complete len:282 (-) Transcript_81158:24-869(-)
MKRKAPLALKLRCVGFCGADDSVEPALLSAISAQHEWVEWGVLCRPDKAGSPRYASQEWLERLGSENEARTMRLAAHLCSTRVDEILNGQTDFVHWLHDAVGFRRVQINATRANGSDVDAFATDVGAKRCVDALRTAFAALPEVEFIMQRNEETRPLWERLLESPPSNMSMLFDDSMGLGRSATKWPEPPANVELAFGYAGGLSPSNLKEQLTLISNTAPGRTIWVDMESSMRTLLQDSTDIFDANKAMLCVRSICEVGLDPSADAEKRGRLGGEGQSEGI